MSENTLAVRPQQTPSVTLELIQSAIAAGITPEGLALLVKTKCDDEDRHEKKEHNAALVELQSEVPEIQASKAVPNKDGSVRYHYAPYEEIMGTLRPYLKKHGFAVTYGAETSEDGKRVTVTCKLHHRGGHTSQTPYTGRIGNGPPMASESQTDGAGYTYAQRFALLAALGITVTRDTDARNVGQPVGEMAADELRRRCKEVGADEAKFLKYAGAATFEEIALERLHDLHAVLDKKEKENAGKSKVRATAEDLDFK